MDSMITLVSENAKKAYLARYVIIEFTFLAFRH